MIISNRFELGRTYYDKISGLEGVATGYVQYISGCNQVLLQPRSKNKSVLSDSQWFDEQRLVAKESHVISLNNSRSPGFDKAPPNR